MHRNLGVVRGISVRTRNLVVDIGIVSNALLGGEQYMLAKLYEDTRQEAYNHLVEHAVSLGANAVLGVRYESTDYCVLCYGTAVLVQAD
jgi:uncharacterized protein YbjQ (UPF0145 family)